MLFGEQHDIIGPEAAVFVAGQQKRRTFCPSSAIGDMSDHAHKVTH
jgi:hypothetical protein